MPTWLSLSEAEWERIDGKTLGGGLAAGDELSPAVVLEFADYVGIGLYNLFQIFNPGRIRPRRRPAELGDLYLERIRKKFDELVRDMLFDPVQILPSKARTGRWRNGSRGATPREGMNKRQRRIIDCLNGSGMTSVRPRAAARRVRRDHPPGPDTPGGRGFLKRVHGGAVLESADDISKRLVVNYESKQRIARAAASFVEEGESILIESGSTNAILVKELGKREGLTIITSNVFIARQLKKTRIPPSSSWGGSTSTRAKASWASSPRSAWTT